MKAESGNKVIFAFLMALVIIILLTAPVRPAAAAEAEARVDLELLSSSPTVEAGNSFDLTIRVHCNGQPVDAAAAYLDFDPACFEVLSVTPGETLDIILENTFDNPGGRIDYGAGSFINHPSDVFTLFTAELKVKPDAFTAATEIRFSRQIPRNTNADYRGYEVLRQAAGVTINIDGRPSPPSLPGPGYTSPAATGDIYSPAPSATPAPGGPSPAAANSLPPSVVTADVTFVSNEVVRLSGILGDMGNAGTVEAYFEWGPTPDTGNATAPQKMTSGGTFTADIRGLARNTVYYYTAVAKGDGTVRGKVASFTTPGAVFDGGISPGPVSPSAVPLIEASASPHPVTETSSPQAGDTAAIDPGTSSPAPHPEPAQNWLLAGGIIAAAAVVGTAAGIWFRMRKAKP